MKLAHLFEIASEVKHPKKFRTGEDFMYYVYDQWPDRNTYVEHQGGGAWVAEIHGDPVIKIATYDEHSKYASWQDADYEEIA